MTVSNARNKIMRNVTTECQHAMHDLLRSPKDRTIVKRKDRAKHTADNRPILIGTITLCFPDIGFY